MRVLIDYIGEKIWIEVETIGGQEINGNRVLTETKPEILDVLL